MSIYIQHIETMTPGVSYPQEFASSKMQGWVADERLKRMIRVLYKKSGIEARSSVIRHFDDGHPDDFFPRGADGQVRELSTAERSRIYSEESQQLAVALAKRAIDACPGVAAADISHVITVSCTGFYNPGPDYYIVNDLALSAATERYNLGFMGCYAAFPGLRMAKQFCQANPDAVVLVICLELCSLHLQLNDREDSMLANSLFADGAAAAIVSARDPQAGQSVLRMGDFHSSLIPDGQADMAWTVGDLGFDIALSSYVPKIIGANIRAALQPVLDRAALSLAAIQTWAVHPGGKAIIDKVAASLELAETQVSASREILRRHGNMSSATILFVLQHLLQQPQTEDQQLCAMAFGPGLTVEVALLEMVQAASPAKPAELAEAAILA